MGRNKRNRILGQKPTIAFVGAGRVAYALATRLTDIGYQITGIASRRPKSAAALAAAIGSTVTDHPTADIIFLTVSDDAIATVAASLEKLPPESAVIHTSGVHSLEVLTALSHPIGSFHPVYPFRPGSRLTGQEAMLIGIEASTPQLEQQLVELAEALGGHPAVLKIGQKALYHAAAVIASNYLVTLFHISQQMMVDAGVSDDLAAHALLELMQGSLNNLKHLSPAAALTGPIARGDVATIERHLYVLADSRIASLYRELGKNTLDLAIHITAEQRWQLEKRFQATGD